MTSGEEFIFDCTAKDFEALVIKSEVPVLVDFWAPWCQPCMQMKPILEKLIRERGGKIALAKVNVDVEQRLAMAFGISSIPDVLIFRDGRPVTYDSGDYPTSQQMALDYVDYEGFRLRQAEALKQFAEANKTSLRDKE